jgi:hypothetical protein
LDEARETHSDWRMHVLTTAPCYPPPHR